MMERRGTKLLIRNKTIYDQNLSVYNTPIRV